MWRQARQALLVGLGFGLAGSLPLIGLRHVHADEAAVELRRLATAVGNGVDGLQATRTGRGASERSAAVEALVTSLDGASAWARANPGTSAAGPEGAAIAKAIVWACASEIVDVTPAAVRAAGWFPHPAATAAFLGTGARWVLLGPATRGAYLETARDTTTPEARRAFVSTASAVFVGGAGGDPAARASFRAALDAAGALTIETPAGTSPSVPAAAVAGILAAFEALLKTPDEGLFTDASVALARAAGAAPRGVLRRAMKARRATRESTTVEVLRALGTAGDAAAIPLLLDALPGTTAPVFEVAYHSLWTCPQTALAPHARSALGVLIPLLHEEGRTAQAASAAATPKAAAVRERMAVVQRLASQMVPPSKEGSGWWALLWRIVDAAGPPFPADRPPPARAGWVHVQGRVTSLSTDDWVAWWKSVR